MLKNAVDCTALMWASRHGRFEHNVRCIKICAVPGETHKVGDVLEVYANVCDRGRKEKAQKGAAESK